MTRAGWSRDSRQIGTALLMAPLRLGLLVFLVLLTGCAPGLDGVKRGSIRQSDTALLTVYLEAQGEECPANVSLSLNNLVLKGENGDLPLYLEPFQLESRQAKGRQLLVGLTEVPPDLYGNLELTLGTISVRGKDQPAQDLTLRLTEPLFLEAGDSQCLFVTWTLDDCLDRDEHFWPNFSAAGQGQPLSGGLLYALADDVSTLYLVRTDNRFVTASIGLNGRAGEMAVDPERRLLYLVNSDRRTLLVFDLTTHRLIDRLPLPLTLEPVHLALDVLGNRAFISDPMARRLVAIDLDSGQVTARQQVGLQPGRLIYFERENAAFVAVVEPRSQQVFLLDAETLAVQRNFETGLQPADLLVMDNRLYVAEVGSRTVTLWDLASSSQVGQVRLNGAPKELLAGTDRDKVFVSMPQTASLGVLRAGQFTSLGSVPAGPDPAAMAISDRRELIFVANPAERQILVLDQASERRTGVVSLGGAPTDLVVFE